MTSMRLACAGRSSAATSARRSRSGVAETVIRVTNTNAGVPLRSGRVEVRRIEVGDGARLRGLRLAALEADPGAFGSSHEREAAYADRHWDMLAGGPGAVFVAGGFEGMAGGYLDEGLPRLWGLWGAPRAGGRGLGRALAGAVVGWARDRAFGRLALMVSDAAAGAERLYRALGFAPTGLERPLESDPSLRQREYALELERAPRRLETERLVIREFVPGDLD